MRISLFYFSKRIINISMQKLGQKYHKVELDDLLKRKYYLLPSFQIYGGVAGLYDFGPPGCALKHNIEELCRNHFIIEENMLEIEGTMLTPEIVLKTSGHVDKFADPIVKDLKDGVCYRADKFLEEQLQAMLEKAKKLKLTPEDIKEIENTIQKIDTMKKEELSAAYKKFNIKSEKGNELSDLKDFNLIFSTEIGPTGDKKGFLRPETAQGIFVNFKRLLEYNFGRIPFAVAQIGSAFRNEISPRAGVLRLREFQMAEIEHFVDPEDKAHPKFKLVSAMCLPLFSAQKQTTDKSVITNMQLGDAVKAKIINNETLAYYLARTYKFLLACGIPENAIRFRQHLKEEMAHYATDCWDAEVECSYGWIEVVGHADRSCFDLSKHSEASNSEMVASRRLIEQIVKNVIELKTDPKAMKEKYKQEIGAILQKLNSTKEEERLALMLEMKERHSIKINIGKEIELDQSMVAFNEVKQTVNEVKYIPHVIEPSFGISRIVFMVLTHCFKMREGKDMIGRTYFAFNPFVAPYKCSILPLMCKQEIMEIIPFIKDQLKMRNLSNVLDDSGTTVGKRYARTDELGIPFAITIDFQTVKDQTVTLREIVSMMQIRIPIKNLADEMENVLRGISEWKLLLEKYPKQEVQDPKEKE